jgi:glycosyltransferase involved in cell wall biosynthesis
MNVAVLTEHYYPNIGGTIVIADLLKNTLLRLGGESCVITRQRASSGENMEPEDRVFRVRSWLEALGRIRNCDLVLMIGPLFQPLCLALALHKPTIISNQIMPAANMPQLKHRLLSILTGSAMEVACSHSLAASITRPTTVVPNPLRDEFDILLDDELRPPGILFSGRLVPEKGAMLLLRAFALIADRHGDAVLTFVGEGPEREGLQREARMLGLSERTHFELPQPGAFLQAIYCRHSVLAVPSVWEEPFGLVALEGLASGCRVVVSRRGGLPEAIGDHGILVESEVCDIADGLDRALAAQPRSAAEKAAIAAHLEKHRPERFTATLLQLAAAKWPSVRSKVKRLYA